LSILVKFFVVGVFSALLFPPFFITPIGFIVFPLLYYLLIKKEYINKNFKFHFLSGFAYGIGLNFIVLIWINQPFLLNQNTKYISIISYFLPIYCAIYYGFSFLILKYFKNNFSKLLLIPVLFVICEIFRAEITYGFPWVTFALVFSSNQILLNMIYYLGTNGLSYLSILIFLFPINIYFLFNNKNLLIYKVYASLILIVILLIPILYFSRINYDQPNNKDFVTVSIIQLNSKNLFEKTKNSELTFKINNIIKNNSSNLLVFAENDLPFIVKNLEDLDFITENLEENQEIIIGATRYENKKFFNSFVHLNKNNIQLFDKKILVPFGEFLPFRSFMSFLDIIVGKNDFSVGENNRLIKILNEYNVIPIICYEIIFHNDLLNISNQNSNLMINITNDMWFGKLSGPYQHFYSARLRAVEFNKNLIRVSNNGVSAIIDNHGNIKDFISLNINKTIKSKLNIKQYEINLVRYHNFVIIFLFIVILFSFFFEKKNYE